MSPRGAVLLCAAGFLLVFFSFSTVQAAQTSRDESVGSVTLAVLYASFAVFSFASSTVVQAVGARPAMAAGSVAYAAFSAAQLRPEPYLLYASGGVLGAAAAVLWTAQGAYITDAAAAHESRAGGPGLNAARGEFNGVFFSVFSFNLTAGALTTAALFSAGQSETLVNLVLVAVSLVGTAVLLLLPAHPGGRGAATATAAAAAAAAPSRSFVGEAAAVAALTRTPQFARLLCAVLANGMAATMVFGVFPPLVEDRAARFYILALLGLTMGAASILTGRAGDRHGHTATMTVGTVLVAAPLAAVGADALRARPRLGGEQGAAELALLAAAAALVGAGYATFQTGLSALVGMVPGPTSTAFAAFKLYQSLAITASFVLFTFVDSGTILVATAAAVVAGTVPLLLVAPRGECAVPAVRLAEAGGEPGEDATTP